ncbi:MULTISPECIES: universal stress protein [Psychromonas]|uniref:universal stress protein n=1 Tax=Psychromonas TaxID=67572 RepID=UPI00040D1574|nr:MULTISPECIES: universal stress protein [Psychromonas]MBB1274074.1 universal stress protein [Psychromonas sp. SR45-3]
MYKNILVPIDLNEKGFSDKAVQLAIWYGKNTDAHIHLLTVLPGVHMSMVATYFPKDAAQKMKADIKTQLAKFAESQMKEKIDYTTYVAEGKAYKTIIKYAEKLKVDLIIMPSHKRSKVDKVMLGSVASKVVQNSPVHVLVVKPQG